MKKLLFLAIFFCLPKMISAQETVITKIILVRHAEKAEDGTKNPPLSENGRQRAQKLVDFLAFEKIDAIYATPYLRTRQTVEPLSKDKNVDIVEYLPGKSEETTRELLKNVGKTTVVVGHSNTIPLLVNTLIGEEKYIQLPEEEFGKIWILIFDNHQLIDCSVYTY